MRRVVVLLIVLALGGCQTFWASVEYRREIQMACSSDYPNSELCR